MNIQEIKDLYAEYDCVTLTAFRSATECNEGTELSLQDNLKRNKSLERSLKSKGFTVLPALGYYNEIVKGKPVLQKENVFIVADVNGTGKLKSVAEKLAYSYEQDSILWKPKGDVKADLIGTSPCKDLWIKLKEVQHLGKVKWGSKGENYTVYAGTPFAF